MKIAVCPFCRVVHEAVGPEVLKNVDDGRRYKLTHCRLCKAPSELFKLRAREEPELGEDELGFPAIVMASFDKREDAEVDVGSESPPTERVPSPRRGPTPGAPPSQEDKAAFLARGLRALKRSWQSGEYVEAEEILKRLEAKLVDARAKKARGKP